MWAWGLNAEGQLGTGSTVGSSVPVQVGVANDWKQVSAGHRHNLAVKNSGQLWGWGWNEYGQVGNGDYDDVLAPVQCDANSTWKYVCAGKNFSLGRKGDQLHCWGHNQFGVFADATFADKLYPTASATDEVFRMLSATENAVFGIANDNFLFAWGDNSDWGLGDGTQVSRRTAGLTALTEKYIQGTSSLQFSAIIKPDGSLWTTGLNTDGVLGLADTTNRQSFTRVGSANDWILVKAGQPFNVNNIPSSNSSHVFKRRMFALKGNNVLWAWGADLGNSPVRLSTDTDWTDIAVGARHALFLKTDGTIWSYGGNECGQLGLGDKSVHSGINQIGTDYDWCYIYAGPLGSQAIKNDGSLWMWGAMSTGDGSVVTKDAPVRLGSRNDWVKTWQCQNVSYGLVKSGDIFVWGGGVPSTTSTTNTLSRLLGINLSGRVGVEDPTLMTMKSGDGYCYSANISTGFFNTSIVGIDGYLYSLGVHQTTSVAYAATPTKKNYANRGIDKRVIDAFVGYYCNFVISFDNELYVELPSNLATTVGAGISGKIGAYQKVPL
jgi:alpha-tubulin suppressor-like RCC1 family protein